NHNYDGKSVVEIRKLDISKEPWPFNYVTGACRESDGIFDVFDMLSIYIIYKLIVSNNTWLIMRK
ncbi:DUF2686 family protein, partial [Escherichia coli]